VRFRTSASTAGTDDAPACIGNAFGASTDLLHDRLDARTMVAAANATFAAFADRIAGGR